MLKPLSIDKCRCTCLSQNTGVTEARYFSSEIISIPKNSNKINRYQIDARTEDLHNGEADDREHGTHKNALQTAVIFRGYSIHKNTEFLGNTDFTDPCIMLCFYSLQLSFCSVSQTNFQQQSI